MSFSGNLARYAGESSSFSELKSPCGYPSSVFATYVGVPVIHAAHAGRLECPLPWTPFTYRGRFEGGASITDGTGEVLARRDRSDGAGFVVAQVEVGERRPRPVPDGFWLQGRGALASVMWAYQRVHGRRAYRRALRSSGARAT